MNNGLGIEVECIQTIIDEIKFLNSRELPFMSHENNNRYIAMIEALEKQIPKKPIKETEDLIGRPIKHTAYSCPRCKVSVNDVIESPYKYCMKCGQAIDKSNNEFKV